MSLDLKDFIPPPGGEKAWSIRWDPEDGWLVDGPRVEINSKGWQVVVPLYAGKYYCLQREYELRRAFAKRLDEGRAILTDHYHGGEEERIEHMEQWIDRLAPMCK